MGVLALVGLGRPGPRERKGESVGGVRWIRGAIPGGGGAGRDAGLGLRVGRYKVAT